MCVLKLLGVTLQHLVARARRIPGFGCPCAKIQNSTRKKNRFWNVMLLECFGKKFYYFYFYCTEIRFLFSALETTSDI
jgi:hypothetical protein